MQNSCDNFQIAEVILARSGLFPLKYKSDSSIFLKIGDIVKVPLRQKEFLGVVLALTSTNQQEDIKSLRSISLQAGVLGNIGTGLLLLIQKAAHHYITELGSIAKLVLPVDISAARIKPFVQNIANEFHLASLDQNQQNILSSIENSTVPILLKGVTGSGKTEIYFHAIAKYLATNTNEQVLLMMPEIALSKQIIDRFFERFGFTPAIWNSDESISKKKTILKSIISGEVRLVIGTRSALFLPYQNLRMIVIDEEHDSSYKQHEGVLYNARDMAILRSKLENSKVLLISATPSIESIHNANTGKYIRLDIGSRYNAALMPNIQIIDMKQETLKKYSWLSEILIQEIRSTLHSNEQILLFLNRRGYAPVMLCKDCGYRFACNSCSAFMVFHQGSKKIECHYCGHTSSIPNECKGCKSENLILCGPGIERIAEEVRNLFPMAKIGVMSADYLSAQNNQQIISQMTSGDIDILIGTQIVTKGYHFPKLTLVGVIDADSALNNMDLRGSERMYQLMQQVGGRAGREDRIGHVLIQSYNPDNKIIISLKNNEETKFIEAELKSREEMRMPPFENMAIINIRAKQSEKAEKLAKLIAKLAPITNRARIMGPAQDPMFKLNNTYRYRILVLADKKFNIQAFIKAWLKSPLIPKYVDLKIDIDP